MIPLRPNTPRARLRRQRAGYTVMEILMAMAVLAVGLVGVASMQRITVSSNRHAKNLAIASHIAQGWLGMLEAEATLWTQDNAMGRTTWIAQGAGSSGWFRPSYDPFRNFGPSFDALGNPLLQTNETDAKFCVDLRFSPLTTSFAGGGMYRTEVRVIWARSGTQIVSGTASPLNHACQVAATQVATPDQRRLFHFVFLSGAVRQNLRL